MTVSFLFLLASRPAFGTFPEPIVLRLPNGAVMQMTVRTAEQRKLVETPFGDTVDFPIAFSVDPSREQRTPSSYMLVAGSWSDLFEQGSVENREDALAFHFEQHATIFEEKMSERYLKVGYSGKGKTGSLRGWIEEPDVALTLGVGWLGAGQPQGSELETWISFLRSVKVKTIQPVDDGVSKDDD